MYQPFLSLLGSALFGTPVNADSLRGCDWEQVLQCAKKQTVTGLIAEAVGKLPDDLQPPAKIKEALLGFAFRNLQANARLNHALATVVGFYRDRGQETVLLKGQGVALCYPVPMARQCGDIDLYVGPERYTAARDMAVERWDSGKFSADKETEKHYNFKVDGIEVELHRIATDSIRPWKRRAFQAWIDRDLNDRGLWRKASIGGTDINLPPLVFDAIYIFYHGYRHFMKGDGLGLRHVCDWVMVLHNLGTDYDAAQLKETLTSLGLLRPWRIMGAMVVEYLGLPESEMPFFRKGYGRHARRLLDDIMEHGNFNYTSERREQWRSAKTFVGRRLVVMKGVAANFFGRSYMSRMDAMSASIKRATSGVDRMIHGKTK